MDFDLAHTIHNNRFQMELRPKREILEENIDAYIYNLEVFKNIFREHTYH